MNDERGSATPVTLTAPMRQFLVWVSEDARTYADVMDAWRSSCPRLSIWEDALDAALVRESHCADTGRSLIMVTARGRASLEAEALTTARA